MALLSWDLISPLSYSISNELSFNLYFEAPINTTPEKFYIIGGLYTDTTYIPDSLFGVLKAAEVDYGVNSTTYISLWILEPGEGVELPCRFIFNRSDCLLALFLMRMVGEEINFSTDEVVAQISVQLVAPKTVFWEQIQDVIGKNIIPIAVLVLLSGIVADTLMGRKED